MKLTTLIACLLIAAVSLCACRVVETNKQEVRVDFGNLPSRMSSADVAKLTDALRSLQVTQVNYSTDVKAAQTKSTPFDLFRGVSAAVGPAAVAKGQYAPVSTLPVPTPTQDEATIETELSKDAKDLPE